MEAPMVSAWPSALSMEISPALRFRPPEEANGPCQIHRPALSTRRAVPRFGQLARSYDHPRALQHQPPVVASLGLRPVRSPGRGAGARTRLRPRPPLAGECRPAAAGLAAHPDRLLTRH